MTEYRTLKECQYVIRPFHITAPASPPPLISDQYQKKVEAPSAPVPATPRTSPAVTMSNLSPYAKPFDPATWCMEPRTPTPDFSPLQPLPETAHLPLSYANVAKPKMPEPFPAYEPPLLRLADFHGQAYSQTEVETQPYGQAGGPARTWRSPIWNTPSRLNLHTYGDQSKPVGEYGVALDAPLPAFGQGKWVNGGPDRQEMAPIGFEMSWGTSNIENLAMRVRRKLWGEHSEQRDELRISSTTTSTSRGGSASASNSSPTTSLSTDASSSNDETTAFTTPSTTLATPSSNITTLRTPSVAIYPATPVSIHSMPTTSTNTSPNSMQSANISGSAQAKGKAPEKQCSEIATVSNGMPVTNMEESKDKFEVPETVDEPTYRHLSDFAAQSVLSGNLTNIEGHIIARQLFHARCRNASSFAVDAAFKASVEVAACDADETATVQASADVAVCDAATRPAASSWASTRAYIPAVSQRIRADALKAILTAFGQITYFDINRQKRCAFVEFATPAQFLAAHNANPHMVGEEIVRVEPRRAKNGPYGSRPR